MSKLQEKPSALKREHHRALQKMEFINFFLRLLVIFALLDPDPDCESRYGFRYPESEYIFTDPAVPSALM